MRVRGWRDRRGSAAVEFALIGPVFILLIIGIVVYGGWFWLAQSVQSLASESARAAIAGLDKAERDQLAQAYLARHADDMAGLNARHASLILTSDDDAIEVRVRYDAHDHPILSLAGLVPAPPAVIERSAVVRLGGY